MRRAWFGLSVLLVAAAAARAGDEPAKPTPTFSQAAPAVCGGRGIEATVALVYQLNTLGPVAGAYIDLGFKPPLDLPKAANELRPRLTSLLPQGAKVGSPKWEGKRLRIALTTTEQGIQPATAFKMRFDCPAGSRIQPSALTCATAEVVGASGEPMEETLAREVRCLIVALDPVR